MAKSVEKRTTWITWINKTNKQTKLAEEPALVIGDLPLTAKISHRND